MNDVDPRLAAAVRCWMLGHRTSANAMLDALQAWGML